jgi:hypothetical protein
MAVCCRMASWTKRDKVGQVVSRLPIDAACTNICEHFNLANVVDVDGPTTPLTFTNEFSNSAASARIVITLQGFAPLLWPVVPIA